MWDSVWRRAACCVAVALAMGVALPSSAFARIVRIEIDEIVPDGTGYEVIRGTAYGEVDPFLPENRIIQDILRAPRNDRGMVEYSTEFEIARPTDGGNGVLLFDVVNRGGQLTEFIFGPSFLGVTSVPRARGYTVVASGWQGDLLDDPTRLNLNVPVATRKNGSAITAKIRTEYIVNEETSTQLLSGGAFTSNRHKSYLPTTLDNSKARLTVRLREADERIDIPSEDWAYADCETEPFPGVPDPTKICLKDGFATGFIYELLYKAKDPLVLGLGYASTRDLVSFLRSGAADDEGNPNPVSGTVATLVHGTSQSGRYIRGFLNLGFNADEAGDRVFDGANPHIATAGIPLNVRFGQPGRAYGQHADHLYPAFEAPFSWRKTYDPISQTFAGVLDRCRKTGTCPKIVSTVSSTEFWQGRASLNQTFLGGFFDDFIPGDVRMYLFSSTQHVGSFFPVAGICQQLNNPNQYIPNLRAVLVALEEWVVDGVEPPPNQIPRRFAGTLVRPDTHNFNWPDIPGVTFEGTFNRLELLDYGRRFNTRNGSGVLREPPEVHPWREYPVLVPQVDDDGNEIAGIRSTTAQAPLGTYAGWNLRAAGFAEDELCGLTGSYIPFAVTEEERLANGDPRPSLEARYGDHDGYVAAVQEAADELVAERFLLEVDAERLVAEAEASNVLQ